VIPTLLVVGFAIGRWWAVPAAVVAWVALLMATGTIGLNAAELAGGATFALGNVAVGVAANRLLLWPVRHRRKVLRAP
jgi:hypothetical protein